MSGLRLTRRGKVVVATAFLTLVVGFNWAMSDKCWNNSGFGYTTCTWAQEDK